MWPALITQTPYFNYTAVLPVFQLQKWICAEKINICEYILYSYLLFLKKSCASAIQCLYWPASPIMIINCLISKDQNQAGFMRLCCPVYFLPSLKRRYVKPDSVIQRAFWALVILKYMYVFWTIYFEQSADYKYTM